MAYLYFSLYRYLSLFISLLIKFYDSKGVSSPRDDITVRECYARFWISNIPKVNKDFKIYALEFRENQKDAHITLFQF